MRKEPAILILLFSALLIFAAARVVSRKPSEVAPGLCPDFTANTLTINGNRFNVAVAQKAQEKIKGLSGCPRIPEQAGLYFPYQEKETPGFWMKDMLIPIDIIWIADGEVVGVEKNVQPQPNTPENQLTLYYPPQPITAVLELPAGSAKKFNITPGTQIP